MNWFTAILTGLFLLVIFYFILVWSYKINTRKLRKRYKEDEDLSKHGEKRRKKLGTRESGTRTNVGGYSNNFNSEGISPTKQTLGNSKQTDKLHFFEKFKR